MNHIHRMKKLKKFKFLFDIYQQNKHDIPFVDEQDHQDFILILQFMMRDLVEEINEDYEREMKFLEITRKHSNPERRSDGAKN